MRANRSHIMNELMALALVALVAGGCSATSSADASVFDQARDLGQDLNRAVSATQGVVIGATEPQVAAIEIDQASSSSRQLAETATRVQTVELRDASIGLVSIANQTIAALSQGDVQRAESLRATRFVPLASELSRLKGSTAATTGIPGEWGAFGTATALLIVVCVVGGVFAVLRRRRAPTVKVAVAEHHPTGETRSGRGQDRTWDTPHPLYETQVSESADSARTTRMRPIDIELRSLLEATIEQAMEREWQVSLVCPDVQISGDPVRVQRAILAALGNAFLEGAELVGVVVDVVDGQALVSIGHDAPIDDAKAENIAIRLANQLALAVDQPELGWSVTADGEIYLTTVSVGTRHVVDTGVELPA